MPTAAARRGRGAGAYLGWAAQMDSLEQQIADLAAAFHGEPLRPGEEAAGEEDATRARARGPKRNVRQGNRAPAAKEER